MSIPVAFLLAAFSLLVICPVELLSLIRRIKRRIRDDLRKRVTAEQWEAIKREFDANDS